MKTLVITEMGLNSFDSIYELNLRETDPKDCTGCWSCWLRTPGKCIYKDLNEFYAKYLEADRVVIVSAITKGFISGRLKTVLDRLIPHYLPFIEVSAEGSNHYPRYEKYPDIEFYYEKACFSTEDGRQILEDFIRRTFVQFRSKNIVIRDIKELGVTTNENHCN